MRILLPFFLFVLSILFSLDTSAQFNPNLTYGTVTDVDGNTYKTIQIGSQVWFAENLRTAKFNNGDSIPHVPDENEWKAIWNNGNPTSRPAWGILRNNPSNNIPYGKLYNWYAVVDSRNICPSGWHVPTDAEYNVLISFLDSAYRPEGNNISQSEIAGGKMKSTGTQFWLSPNGGATNSSGYSALAGGSRTMFGSYGNSGNGGYWWTASDSTSLYAWMRGLGWSGPEISKYINTKGSGNSVRCIQNTVPSGATVYTTPVSTTSFAAAVSGGKVINDGGTTVTERGICWSTSPLPTVSNNKSVSGSGMGNYAASLTALQESSIYYVRAYAVNSTGITYGNQLSFKTGSSAPSAHSCGSGDVHNSNLTYGTMTDQEGNVYKTIQIGTQTWMAENLKTTIYRNGDLIPSLATGSSNWRETSNGTWGYYKNDSTRNCPYGKLYNWYTVSDNRNICPSGWHIPTDGEWNTLEIFLGGTALAGSKLKSAGTAHWPSKNTDATNSSGFSALATGFRSFSGGDADPGKTGYWSSTTEISNYAWMRTVNYASPEIFRISLHARSGLYVRCLKDISISPPTVTTQPVSGIAATTAGADGI